MSESIVDVVAGDAELEVLQSDPEMAAMFIAEALDHLSTIEALLLQLESAPTDVKLLNDIFRPFHTVKGNAGALGIVSVQELAHKVENLLDLARSGKLSIGQAAADVILKATDLLSSMITDINARLAGQRVPDVSAQRNELMQTLERLVKGDTTPPPAAAAPPSAPAAPAAAMPAAPTTAVVVLRVAAAAGAAPPAAPSPPAAAPPVETRRQDLLAQAVVKVDMRKLDSLVDMVGELVIVQSIIGEAPALARVADEALTRNLAQLRRITGDLQRNAMAMRMVPIRATFQKMARLVRDLSRASGKAVDLVLSGEDTELDRKVVEEINDPLMHMIRNSVDHGIEAAAARREAGKPEVGRLSLAAFHRGGSIVIEISDDGAGLPTEKIRAKAVAQGLISEGQELTPAEIHQLIFAPGVSTAAKVTEISGRGVGMDVVRRNIDALRGRIDIQSTPGRGTTFSIKLPLTLAILDGLILGASDQRFVLPTFSVRESLRPRPEQIKTVGGEACLIQVRDTLMPLVEASALFKLGGRLADPSQGTVVVIEDDARRVGLLVDALLGKQEVVIKPLGDTFANVRGIAGGAILGDGRVGLILDGGDIVKMVSQDLVRA